MKHYFSFCLFFLVLIAFGQDSLDVDTKYREDQFYASVTYNLLSGSDNNIKQSDFSTGFHFGFIRDMPFSKHRNWSIGVGLGLSTNSYNQNLILGEDTDGISFNLQENLNLGNVSKNKFTTYLIDIPFELRWRTSTPTSYKFWRIYPGFKLSYLVYNSTKLKSETLDSKLYNLDVFNEFQYGLTLSIGYGTWNFQVYYALNPIFNSNSNLDGNSVDLRALKVGLMFYIL